MITGIVIIRVFWCFSQKKIENPSEFFWKLHSIFLKNSHEFRRMLIRIFWGSSSSEFSEDPNPQNILRILILSICWRSLEFFWRSSSLEFSEDRHPQQILRILILRIFCGSSSSVFSEDRHPQNFLKIVILRMFWGSSSFEFSEDHHPQNFLRILILWFFWGSSEFSINKRVLNENVPKKRLCSNIKTLIEWKSWGSS